MQKKIISLLSTIIFLTSCSSRNNTSYYIYFGNMFISHDSYQYQALDQVEVQNDYFDDEDGVYYADIYVIHNIDELASLRADTNFIDNQEEIEIPENKFLVYFFVQIPRLRRGVTRENIQYQDETGREVMVTDNFYQLASRPDLFYCFVDLTLNIQNEEPTVFSFYYYVSNTYQETMTSQSIRLIFNELEED